MFVDHSGRRARRVRIVGVAVAGLCALWLAGLVVGSAGFSDFPAARPPIRALPALARVAVARGTGRTVEARELVTSHPRPARES